MKLETIKDNPILTIPFIGWLIGAFTVMGGGLAGWVGFAASQHGKSSPINVTKVYSDGSRRQSTSSNPVAVFVVGLLIVGLIAVFYAGIKIAEVMIYLSQSPLWILLPVYFTGLMVALTEKKNIERYLNDNEEKPYVSITLWIIGIFLSYLMTSFMHDVGIVVVSGLFEFLIYDVILFLFFLFGIYMPLMASVVVIFNHIKRGNYNIFKNALMYVFLFLTICSTSFHMSQYNNYKEDVRKGRYVPTRQIAEHDHTRWFVAENLGSPLSWLNYYREVAYNNYLLAFEKAKIEILEIDTSSETYQKRKLAADNKAKKEGYAGLDVTVTPIQRYSTVFIMNRNVFIHDSKMPLGKYDLLVKHYGYKAKRVTVELKPGMNKFVVGLEKYNPDEMKVLAKQLDSKDGHSGFLIIKVKDNPNSTFQILNIREKFHQGMVLPYGKYKIKVTSGNQSKTVIYDHSYTYFGGNRLVFEPNLKVDD